MRMFKLPDLGEGLPDAVIREWHVSEGDSIATHQSLVTVETAKALVEVPAPFGGVVEKLYASPGDTVEVGQPLVGFAARTGEEAPESPSGQGRGAVAGGEKTAGEKVAGEKVAGDAGTVVGRIQAGAGVLATEQLPGARAERWETPAVRALARRLGVDLAGRRPQGARFTEAEVRRLAAAPASPRVAEAVASKTATAADSPARRAMAQAMAQARDRVAPMTLCDEVDVSAWWGADNPTLRLLRAIGHAAAVEPNLNALYRDERLEPAERVSVGLAVDSPRGLFVPVLKDVGALSDDELLARVEQYKLQARETGIARDDLQGATILLSNFGGLGGRFATPVVLPPTVAIVGAGRVYQGVVPVGDRPAVRPLLPVSISADHRAVTGGELARFLGALVAALSS
ncbi:dihydrolipoamide acetyltransferase family protein [Microbulbifer yueqingensis]|uniref:Dihydrolipoamide acetyltransferase component of pyruvate dehydrogenase complex n=1 Tax=Microbulbifer yueqingensis TaxID=658219 RepID=A0A1G9BQX1_9GAMM|nr:dihydrolipoamide acetyltransferase family protein [Microbulbifer yueqingensis]SDK41882.1 pyruvate dehydrogenase E2 component (dihydrolipoamide acetyltransferase) [Microbulbifer yueqingensis]